MLKPPKGCAPTIAPVHLRLKYRLPTWKRSLASRRWAGVFEKTAPVRPYCESLASESECSKSLDLVTARTGPKISSWKMRALESMSAMMVGGCVREDGAGEAVLRIVGERERVLEIVGLGDGDRKEHTSELQSPCNLVCRLL